MSADTIRLRDGAAEIPLQPQAEERLSAPRFPLAVIHGRFQVLHNDHMRYLLAGKARCSHLVIGITNPDPSLTAPDDADPERSTPAANPLTYYERQLLVRACLLESGVGEDEFSVVPFPINRPELYRYYVPLDAVFLLTIYDEWGRRKLRLFQACGLTCEVLWERPNGQKGLSGREIRTVMARGGNWQRLVPPAAADLLSEWDVTRRIAALQGMAVQEG